MNNIINRMHRNTSEKIEQQELVMFNQKRACSDKRKDKSGCRIIFKKYCNRLVRCLKSKNLKFVRQKTPYLHYFFGSLTIGACGRCKLKGEFKDDSSGESTPPAQRYVPSTTPMSRCADCRRVRWYGHKGRNQVIFPEGSN